MEKNDSLSLSLSNGSKVELWLCCPSNISLTAYPTYFPLFLACTMPQNDFLWSIRFGRECMGRGCLGGQRAPKYPKEVNHCIFLFSQFSVPRTPRVEHFGYF